MVKIPIPKFVVFYNGDEDQPDVQKMKLSDAYERKVDNPELEVTCTIYNINFGKNEELLEKCKIIKDYMTFVNYVRLFHKEQEYDDLQRAINRAIDRCVEEDVLAVFLKENRSEVVKVTQLDYTFDRQIMLEREDAREEGFKEGREEGREEGKTSSLRMVALNMIAANMPAEEISKLTGLSVHEIEELY